MLLGSVGTARRAFRDWRRSRPFWAGVWTVLAGVEILSIPLAPLDLLIHEGVAGVSGVLMGLFMVVLGLTLWLAPRYRVFAGIATLVFAVASLVLSNLGGFLVGFLLGVLGGSMAVSWVPERPPGPRRPGRNRKGSWGPPGEPDAGTDPDPDAGAGMGAGPGTEAGTGVGPGEGPGPGTESGTTAGAETGSGRTGAAAASGRSGSGPTARNPLLAFGILPVGALLATGLQPPPSATARSHTPRPDRPRYAAEERGRNASKPTVCSLLDAVLTAAGATPGSPPHRPGGHSEGRRERHAGHHGETGRAPGHPVGRPRHASPGLSSTPAPAAPRSSPDHGRDADERADAPVVERLLGAVSGLIGTGERHSAERRSPDPTIPHPRSSGRRSAEPRPSEPHPSDRHPSDRHPSDSRPYEARSTGLLSALRAGHAPHHGDRHPGPEEKSSPKEDPDRLPAQLTVSLPPLPRDGGMDRLASLLPLRIRAGVGTRPSPWCLPEISLEVSLGARRFGARTAVQPSVVRTPLLLLTGLTYRGITEVDTASGPERVLAFTAFRVDIHSLRQDAPLLAPHCPDLHGAPAGWGQAPPRPPIAGPLGLSVSILGIGLPHLGLTDFGNPWPPCQGNLSTEGSPGGTVTATGTPVVILSKLLSGRLLGLLPVTFTPRTPPPLPPGLTLPIPIFMTDVTAHNHLLSADRLTVPGLLQTASR